MVGVLQCSSSAEVVNGLWEQDTIFVNLLNRQRIMFLVQRVDHALVSVKLRDLKEARLVLCCSVESF